MHKEAEFLQKLLPGYYMVGAGVGSRASLQAPAPPPASRAVLPPRPQLLSAHVQEQRLQGPVDPPTGPQEAFPGSLSLTLGDPSGDPPILVSRH